MVFVTSIIRHKVGIIYVFFVCFCSKIIFYQKLFLIAAINLTTRCLMYTFLVLISNHESFYRNLYVKNQFRHQYNALLQFFQDSCLSYWLSFQLRNLSSLPVEAIAFIVSFMLTFLTEITSNTATASILLPILGSLVSDYIQKDAIFYLRINSELLEIIHVSTSYS